MKIVVCLSTMNLSTDDTIDGAVYATRTILPINCLEKISRDSRELNVTPRKLTRVF